MDEIVDVNRLLKLLKSLKPYIYHTAKTGSVYIKFENPFYGSIRIGNHPGYDKYSYKWNLRSDINSYYEEEDRGVFRRYYPINELARMIKDLKELHSVCISPMENYIPYMEK